MKKTAALLVSALLAGAAACGDSTGPEPSEERIAAGLRLDQSSVTLEAGETVRVTVTVLDQFGAAFSTPPAGTTITWEVTDPTLVALQAGQGGLFADLTGLQAGGTQVRASLGAQQAAAEVTVTPAAVPTGTVTGVVTAGNGTTPIPGAVVTLKEEAGAGGWNGAAAAADAPSAVTDAEGRYTLEDVPAGARTLAARKGFFYAEIQVTVAADQTVTAPGFRLEPDGKMGYVAGAFDSIEDIVAQDLGWPIEEIEAMDLASAAITSQYRMIFLNCGIATWLEEEEEIVANLRAYIDGGGMVYASDLELYVVQAMFPEQVLDIWFGDAQVVTADVVDDGLRAFLQGMAKVAVEYDLDGWATLAEISAGPSVLLRGSYTSDDDPVPDAPLAIFIGSGDGRLVFTTFHNNVLATDDQLAVLRYFVFGFSEDVAGDEAGPMASPAGLAPATPAVIERHRVHRELRYRAHRHE